MRNNMFLSFQMLKLTKKTTKYTILLIPNFFSSSDNIIIVVIKNMTEQISKGIISTRGQGYCVKYTAFLTTCV